MVHNILSSKVLGGPHLSSEGISSIQYLVSLALLPTCWCQYWSSHNSGVIYMRGYPLQLHIYLHIYQQSPGLSSGTAPLSHSVKHQHFYMTPLCHQNQNHVETIARNPVWLWIEMQPPWTAPPVYWPWDCISQKNAH